MVQVSEVLNLIFNSIGLVVIVALYRGGIISRYRHIMAGFVCVWAGNVCTVAEGFIWPNALNLLEHLFFMVSGILFFMGFFTYLRKGRPGLS